MVKLKAKPDAKVGETSKFSVELVRPGAGALTDSRKVEIIAAPPAQQGKQKLSMPRFEFVRIASKDDTNWTNLGWPDDTSMVASFSEFKDGVLTVYYSTLFPEFENGRRGFEQKDPALAQAFELRYRIWLAVHSFLLHRAEDDAGQEATMGAAVDGDAKAVEDHEAAERCRVARMAVMVADSEIKNKKAGDDD